MNASNCHNLIRQKWQEGTPVINGWLSLADSFSAEIMASFDWDSLTIDAQHGMASFADIVPILQALKAAKKPILIRVPWLREESIMQYLDAGADGLICPMINNKQQAEDFVSFSSYPPLGVRSMGPTRALFAKNLDKETYFNNSNTQIVRLAMIETQEAVTNMDEIIAVAGIDGIYIGPSDLAVSFGFSPGMDRQEEKLIAIIKQIVQQTHKKNKKVGLHTVSANYAKKVLSWGLDLVTVSSDVQLLSSGAATILKSMRS